MKKYEYKNFVFEYSTAEEFTEFSQAYERALDHLRISNWLMSELQEWIDEDVAVYGKDSVNQGFQLALIELFGEK